MKIVTIRNKRLKRYFYEGYVAGLQPEIVRKLRFMLDYLELISDEAELTKMPHWKPHRLVGELEGYWSLTVTRNWRLIFQVDGKFIVNLDLVDYH